MKKSRVFFAALLVAAGISAPQCINALPCSAASDDTATGVTEADDTATGVTETDEVPINESNFPDKVFRDYVKKFDKDDNGSFSQAELDRVYNINCSAMKIKSLKGLEYFTSLESLDCSRNELAELRVSKNTKLKSIECNSNSLRSLDLQALPKLEYLLCYINDLGILDVSANTELTTLNCDFNELSELDVSACPKLLQLSCEGNDLTKIDVSHNPNLVSLNFSSAKVSELNLDNNAELSELYCDCNPLGELDLSHVNLRELKCVECGLDELDLSGQTRLERLDAFANNIRQLDLGERPELTWCNVNFNLLTELDVTGCPNLVYLDVRFCYMKEYPKGAPENKWVEFEPQRYVGPVEGLKVESAGSLPVKISWSDVKEADAFEVFRSESETDDFICIDESEDLIYQDTTALPDKTYYYKVRGYRTMMEYSGKFYGDFSEVVKVITSDSGRAPSDPENPGFENFVERLYTVALNRESDPEGKAYWVRQVVEEGATGADCARYFLLGSDEFLQRDLTIEDFVEILYDTFFDRVSDAAGKKGWVDAIRSGKKTRAEVVNDFIESTEWCDVCASYGVKSGALYHKATRPSENAVKFATRLYTCCLNRDAEEGGLRYWSLALTNLEKTGADAAREFFESEEFVGYNTTDQEYIRRLYTTFMGRDPGGNEVAYWLREITEGRLSRHSILSFFAQSDEFTKICKQYGIERGEIA